MKNWTDWIDQIAEEDRLRGSNWYWSTITPTTIYNEVVSWNERNVETSRLTDSEYVAKLSPTTARHANDALHATVQMIDLRFNKNHPSRTAAASVLATLLIPALKVRDLGRGNLIRVLHYHGWIVLPKIVRQTTEDPREYEWKTMMSRWEETPHKITVPEPIAMFANQLADRFGSNINVQERPETDESLRTHALYATRGFSKDVEKKSSQINHETSYPEHAILLPNAWWSPRIAKIA